MKQKIMKRLGLMLYCTLLTTAGERLSSQNCCINFLTTRYDQLKSHTVLYSENAELANGSTVDLYLTYYTPVEDTCTNRPLLILLHGGGYIGGDRFNMLDVALDFARRGWVTASIDYRLGWLGETYCPVDQHETIRAYYRSILDCRDTIDFLIAEAPQLGIDTNRIFLGGWSAGAYAAIGAAYLTQPEELPAACYELTPITVGTNTIERPALPLITTTKPIKGVLSLAGACFDYSIINTGEPPLLMFNNITDEAIIPYDECAPWWVEPCIDTAPLGCGQLILENVLAELEIPHHFVLYNEDICSHNMQSLCFPEFTQEMQVAASFFYHSMDLCDNECTVTISVEPDCDNHIVNYYTQAVSGANYEWIITDNGIIISGQGSNAIQVYWIGEDIGTVTVARIIE